MHGWHADVFRDRAQAFGWTVLEIDGHDVEQIDRAYRDAASDDRPTFIVARTEKGHGVSFLADQEGWHGKAVPAERMPSAIAELGGERHLVVTPPSPPELVHLDLERDDADAPAPAYDGPIATRKAVRRRARVARRAGISTSWSSTARSATRRTPRRWRRSRRNGSSRCTSPSRA